MGKFLVLGGAVLVVLGLLVMAGFPLFRLPGDITVRRGPVTFYFPLATSILFSILLTLIMMFFAGDRAKRSVAKGPRERSEDAGG